MSEQSLIEQSAPTLAGLKTASLFTAEFTDRRELHEALCSLNQRLSTKGVRVIPVRYYEKRVLLYVYRPRLLAQDLGNKDAMEILESLGYPCSCVDRSVVKLVNRLAEQEEFPHEIGFFLGYPPEDVMGFMQDCKNGCRSCIYTGDWKVYKDADAAINRFNMFRKCRRVYKERAREGYTLDRLTVR